jgi:putative heme-binding domain-containing protein
MTAMVVLLPALLLARAALAAQDVAATHPAANNPHLHDRASVHRGRTLYRVRCGDCHGLDAMGYRGPDLTAVLAGGVTDERLFQTIRNGVPGTEMAATNAPDDDLLLIIAFLRDLGGAPASEQPSGDVEHGRRLFDARCTSCHRVGGQGGRLGPDLTRIGASRSRAALVREIRTPSEWIAPSYEAVTLVTKDGQRVRGAKKNEDTFSIQIMDVRERIRGFLKSDLDEVIHEKDSLMPAFGPAALSDSDLGDVVAYLSTLRGADRAVK